MAPIMVAGWTFQNGRWTKGSYTVTQSRKGFKAWMPVNGRNVCIGTSGGEVTRFLAKIDHFAELKDVVYA
jgi:hypothetical protein